MVSGSSAIWSETAENDAMAMTELSGVLGLALSILALIGIAYGIFFRLGVYQTKIDTLWGIFLEDSKFRQTQLGVAKTMSDYRLTDAHKRKLPTVVPVDIRDFLEKLRNTASKQSDEKLVCRITKYLGPERMRERCRLWDCTPSDYLARCIIWIREVREDGTSAAEPYP